MGKRLASLLAVSLLSIGCSVTPWQLPAGHPADPQAHAGSPAPAKANGALDRYRGALQRIAAAQPGQGQPAADNDPASHAAHDGAAAQEQP